MVAFQLLHETIPKLKYSELMCVSERTEPSSRWMHNKGFKTQPSALVIIEAHYLLSTLWMKRPMHCDEMVVDACFYGKCPKIFKGVTAEVPTRPANRLCRSVVKSFHRKLSSDSSVVIAGNA
nr:hypothetical protein [Microvirga sp. VF16]